VRYNIYKHSLLGCAVLLVLYSGALYSDSPTRQIPAGKKVKVEGRIQSRSGDLITVKDRKSGDVIGINLFEDTKIERKVGRSVFARHPRMDITAMLPGLTIEAEGVGNAKGQLNADKISFSPDDFAVAIAEEQQITANQATTHRAQSTADQGLDTANVARASAMRAQSSADQAQDTAEDAAARADSAGRLGVLDAMAVQLINKRVSDLDDYETIAEVSLYFRNGQGVLSDADKEVLDRLGSTLNSLDGYMIEIAGYASAPGSTQWNQKLSEERAATVADYLRETQNVPMRRILAPAGYGSSQRDSDSKDVARDRRVDVKVLVNKAQR
jgi:outer membrane protein OmpA-like peptidoglycan-associated protein